MGSSLELAGLIRRRDSRRSPAVKALAVIVAVLLVACPNLRDSRAFDQALLIPHGRHADLDTHRLYYECQGEGRPMVLIDYGIAGSAVGWRKLQAKLATITTVCAYDRAGYGWSDPGPSPRTAGQAVEELQALIVAAGWAGPFVLLGHSFGGFDTRLFAARHPELVAGLVWLDSSHPAEALQPDPPGAHGPVTNPVAQGAIRDSDIDDDEAAGAYLNTRRKALFTQMDELSNFSASARQVLEAGKIPDVPLVVVTRDRAQGQSEADAARWRRRQQELALLSPQGVLWTAEGSGHEIHRDRPDVVVKAVRRVVDEVRAAGLAHVR